LPPPFISVSKTQEELHSITAACVINHAWFSRRAVQVVNYLEAQLFESALLASINVDQLIPRKWLGHSCDIPK